MAKHLLKRPLKIDAPHSFSFPIGTQIETSDKPSPLGKAGFRQVIVDGSNYPAHQSDIENAIMPRDFARKNLGIRVFDQDCAVIERKAGVNGWVEDGKRFPLPLPDGFAANDALASKRLVMAFRAYETESPLEGLRELLTAKVALTAE